MKRMILLCLLLASACEAPLATEQRDDLDAVTSAQRAKFSRDGTYLILEFLDDDLMHFEVSRSGAGSTVDQPIYTTPMVAKHDYAGPSSLARSGAENNVFDTNELHVVVDTRSFCMTIADRVRRRDLTTICPFDLANDWKGLTLARNGVEHVYGLGEQFTDPGTADGSWIDRVRSPGGSDGNALVGFAGGAPGNTQIPIMYAVAPDVSWAFFLDQVYKQEWDFRGDRFRASMWGDQIRGYVMSGPALPDLRSDYMELVGRPLVPPRKMFGYWSSEFGYENWDEVDRVTNRIQNAGFPLDGVALDLFWFGSNFGGGAESSGNGSMGKLSFDERGFPDPHAHLASMRDRGLGVMLIEESYVNRGLAEHDDLSSRGFLAKDCDTCGPTFLDSNPWWGKGGMIDWTNAAAGDYWHDLKRKPLVDMGVVAFWADLGEPEMYNPWASYFGFPELGKRRHADIHNIYALDWLASIARGYERNGARARPFIMSRAGTAGIQRYGGAMWSGDIGSNQGSLAAHLRNQMHMSMSGVDYYGADIGGFHRSALDGNLDELYTQWFANGMMLDIPARTHAWNLSNNLRLTPDLTGHAPSNLANARLRYALRPYVYSLAHRAHLFGEPIFPPLAYAYEHDANVGEMGSEKLIGRDLLVGIVARYGETERDIYLPRGKWIDFFSHEWIDSRGEWKSGLPEYRGGIFRLPLFARAGAIIPMSSDVLRIYPDSASSSFTLYEDDGETIDYLAGALQATRISQTLSGSTVTITIDPAIGSYTGAPSTRDYELQVVAENARATAAFFNGQAIAWSQGADNLITLRVSGRSVLETKAFRIELAPAALSSSVNFVCDRATTSLGESVYITGDLAELGRWSPAAAVKLDPNSYPKWSGVISGLPPSTTFRWKCIKRLERDGAVTQWLPGNDRVFRTSASGPSGSAYATF